MTPTRNQGLVGLLRRRWKTMGATLCLVAAGGAAVLWAMPKKYESVARLLVMHTDQRTGGIQIVDDDLPQLNSNSSPVVTLVELMRSTPVLGIAAAHLGGGSTADSLARSVKIGPVPSTDDLIEVSDVSRKPIAAQQAVKAVCDAYLERLQNLRQVQINDGLKFLDNEVGVAKGRLAQAQQKLLEFRGRIGSLPVSDRIDASVTGILGLETDLRTQQIALADARAREASLRAQLGSSPERAFEQITIAKDREVQALQDQLVAAEANPALTSELGPDNPDLKEARARVESLRAKLDARVRRLVGHSMPVRALDDVAYEQLVSDLATAQAEVQGRAASVRAIEAHRAQIASSIHGLPALEVTADGLKRDADVAQTVYQDLLTKREQVLANLSVAPTDVQVVVPANLPTRPRQPLGGMALPVLMVSALAAAYLAALLRDILDPVVSSRELVACLPRASILAQIPFVGRSAFAKGEILVRRDGPPAYIEALRSLALAIESNAAGARTIALTSATSGEGKSVTVANLAVCLADAGHRVLIVDSDLWRGRQNAIFRLKGQLAGLAEVLAGKTAPLDVPVHNGQVAVVPAGLEGRNLRLAAVRDRFPEAMAAWKAAYDFVLVDLPPLNVLSRVGYFVRHVDGVLMLANMHCVSHDVVAMAGQQLAAIPAPVLGLAAVTRSGGEQASAYLVAPPVEAYALPV